ncbi:hypothetical protein [Jeotgalibacillus malaysiensis]|uniref:hypothetical protein n=1 Tax=Jeotgalibacillus malaysiensis TaxID=1508404 RepID=UPI00384C8385
MDITEGVDFNSMQFVWPIIILFVSMFITAGIARLIFGMLPKSILNFLVTAAALLGAYIWAIPMEMGFYEFFR